MLGVIYLAVGIVLTYVGHALITDRHTASDWWLDHSAWTRDLFGPDAQARSREARINVFGAIVMALGAASIAAGVGSLA